MEINLIIPRHPYGSLKPENGSKREYLHLSPEGVRALNRLATCSRSAAADLAIRVLHVVAFGEPEQIRSTGQELVKVLDGNDGLAWLSLGLGELAETLDASLKANLKVSLSS